jgi:hypothetical protein
MTPRFFVAPIVLASSCLLEMASGFSLVSAKKALQTPPLFLTLLHSTPLDLQLQLHLLDVEPATLETWWQQVDAFWQTSPYTAAAIVCGIKASAADFIAQSNASFQNKQANDNDNDDTLYCLDMRRNIGFLIYGSLYQGISHEYIFNHLYPAWFGTGTSLEEVAIKVAFNLFLQTTLVTLPIFYLLQAGMVGDSCQTALVKYKHDIVRKELWQKCWLLWGPTMCVTFSVVPEHWRVTFVAVVSFFWLILLSSISGSKQVVVAAVEENTAQPRNVNAAQEDRWLLSSSKWLKRGH